MADQVSNLTSNTTGSGLSGITGVLQGNINKLTSTGQSLLDRYFPPETRQTIKQKLTAFATERPILASFILSQIALSGLPLVLFLIMSVTVVIFALLTGILVGLIGALVFVVMALGFALLVLLPTLFATTFFAVAIWLWGVGAYYIVKWFNQKSIPGIHRPLGQGFLEETGLGELPMFRGLSGGDANGHEKEMNSDGKASGIENGHHEKKEGDVRQRNGSAMKAEPRVDGKDTQSYEQSKSPHAKKDKLEDESVTKVPTKGVAGATRGVGDVGKGVTGAVA